MIDFIRFSVATLYVFCEFHFRDPHLIVSRGIDSGFLRRTQMRILRLIGLCASCEVKPWQ